MSENDPKTESPESPEVEKNEVDEEKLLENLLTDISDRLNSRKALREENLDPNFEKNKPKGKLDSTIKKNSAFVKELGTIKEAQKESLEKEFAGLNFGRYVAEAAAAIADAKFKSQEIDAVASLCANTIFKNRRLISERINPGRSGLLTSCVQILYFSAISARASFFCSHSDANFGRLFGC